MHPENDPAPPEGAQEEYEPPAIVESTRFETIAQACIYGPDDGVPCTIDPSQAGG